MNALLDYFGVEKDYFYTEQPEEVIIEKNISIRRLKSALWGIVTIFMIVLILAAAPILLTSNQFGFTSEMAAGVLKDNPCIKTDNHDIYYSTFCEGEEYEYISNFRPVKKLFIGYYVYEEDYISRDLYAGDDFVGRIYSIEGDDCYYNIITKPTNIIPNYMLVLNAVTVNGKEYPVMINSYFVTEEPFDKLIICDTVITVQN